LISDVVCNFKTGKFAKKITMNIALIGYGRMGHEIEVIAVKRGHVIKFIADLENIDKLNKASLEEVDVAIEFSSPDSAFGNIVRCLELSVPVVSGTTGWLSDYDKAVEICKQNNTSFIHSSNFSIGVNLLLRLNKELARQMNRYNDYNVSIEEIHHTKKLDAPSGTAIAIADGIVSQHSGYDKWCFEKDKTNNCVSVTSVRYGLVPGTHTVVAAEFIHSRVGVFTMNDVMGF